MVDNDFLAKEIEQELNEIAQTNDITFKIHDAVGDYKSPILEQTSGRLQPYVNGVLRMLGGEYASLSDIQDLFSEHLLEIAVKQEEKELVEAILKTWVNLRLGESKVIEGEGISYILTPTPPIPGSARDTGKLGAMLSYSINIKVQSIKNGLLSNMVHWTISTDTSPEAEIKRIRSSFVTVRTPTGKPIINKSIVEYTNSYANNQITFDFPYIIDQRIVREIENDILVGNKDRVYTIRRKSPVGQYSGKYIMTQGTINEENGAVVGFNLVFSKAKETSNV